MKKDKGRLKIVGKGAVLQMWVMRWWAEHKVTEHVTGGVLCCHVLANIQNTCVSFMVLLLPPHSTMGSFKYLLWWTPTHSLPWFYHEYFTILAYDISTHIFLHHRFHFNLDVLTLYSVNSSANWLWISFTIGVFRNLNIQESKQLLYSFIYYYRF